MANFFILLAVFGLFFWVIFDKFKRDSDEINKLHDHEDKQ